MPLTEIAIRQAKSKEKLFFLNDGRGLMLEVRPTGKKSWVVRYYIKGKESRKVIGIPTRRFRPHVRSAYV